MRPLRLLVLSVLLAALFCGCTRKARYSYKGLQPQYPGIAISPRICTQTPPTAPRDPIALADDLKRQMRKLRLQMADQQKMASESQLKYSEASAKNLNQTQSPNYPMLGEQSP